MKILKTLFTLVLLLVSTNAVLAATPYERAVALMSTINASQVSTPYQLATSINDTTTCIDLKYNLESGLMDGRTNGEVTKLQNFLYSKKYLTVNPTGGFYTLTTKAVASFQRDNGISPAVGYVGPITRAKLKEITCGVGEVQTLSINNINPSVAKVGETVVLSGPGLNSGRDYVLFDGHRIETDGSKVLNRVSFVVPEYLTNTINCITTPCPQGYARKVEPGEYKLQVVNNKGATNIVELTVIDKNSTPPTDTIKISWVEPIAAKVGTDVTIYGYNLSRSETKILFDGVTISGTPVYSRRSGNFNSAMKFTVPEYLNPPCNRVKPTEPCPLGMVRQVVPGTYELAVENKYGRDSVKFEVLGDLVAGKPQLSSLSPTMGVVGATVSIFGENINSGSEVIYFAGSRVTPLVSSATDRKGVIRFRVPEYITPCGYEANTVCRMMARLVTPGKYEVVVKNEVGVSNALIFEVNEAVSTDLEITSFYATDYTFSNGSSVGAGRKLVWTSTGAEYCVASGAWSGTRPVNGEYTIGFMSQPLTYTLKCYNNKGVSVTKSVTDPSTGTTQEPIISKVSPSSASVGTQITLTGERLNTGSAQVIFGDGVITPDATRSSDSVLVFTIPSAMSRYCSPLLERVCTDDMISVTSGSYSVKVVNSFGTSNAKPVSIIAETVTDPSISSISPASGGTGVQVGLSGSNLDSASDYVWFGGVKITPNRYTKSVNSLVFTVPQTLFQCDAKPGEECLAVYQPTPLGSYQVKVENSKGKTSNAVNYQVTSSGSDY